MADTGRPNRQISERRRQQNVQAQKNYRERQKRRMKALEELLVFQENDGVAKKDGGDVDAPSHLCPRQPSDCRSLTIATRPADDAVSYPGTSQDPLEAFNYLTGEIGNMDDQLRMRIRSGEITIEDIWKAGLDALRSRQSTPLAGGTHPDNLNPGPALRTDKILVPQNSMRIHQSLLPDIYSNHLRIKQFSTVAALRLNAEHLGLTFEDLVDPETVSPFYSGAVDKEGTQELLADSRFLKLKPHLRPTSAQIGQPHHPYIDVVPCAVFRQRCIQLLSMEPPMIDEGELCDDFEKDGLICWGSYLGAGQEATGSGAPWDLRSWEAQPWFLKKWWFLVGGAEGPLFQQSRWWHAIRGDQLP